MTIGRSVGRRAVLRSALAAAGIGAVATGLAACTGDDADSGSSGAPGGSALNSDPGTAVDPRVVFIAASDRKAGPVLSGTLLDGTQFDLSSWDGKPVVVNVWGSWCGPCKVEQPGLVTAAARLTPTGVHFLGLDQKDTPANAQAHNRHFGVTYPSLSDTSGRQLLSFRGLIPPAAVPSTVVLDAEHRVAAVKIGRTTATTVVTMVAQVTGRQAPA